MSKLLTICLLTLTVPLCGAAEKKALVRLIDSIAVEAPSIVLGEIATIDTEDASLLEQLLTLEITTAPSINNPRVINAIAVRRAIEQMGLTSRVEVLGMQTVASLATRPVSDQEMLTLIEKWVDDNVDPSCDAEIDNLRLPPRWQIPAGDKVNISLDCGGRHPAGSLVVTLRAQVGDQVLSTTRAKVEVRLYRDHLVLARPLSRKQIITLNDVEKRRVDVTDLSGMELADKEQVIGLAAKRELPVGTTISLRDFEQPIAVERGSLNRIVVINNEVKVNIAGAQALQSGKVGDTILFTNPINAKEPLRARIIKAGVAIIELGQNYGRTSAQ